MKVLITGATRNAGMAVIRGLSEDGFDVISADERRLPFNAHSCYSRPSLIYPKGYQRAFIETLLEIIEKEKPDIFLPVNGARISAMHRKDIQKKTRLLISEPEVFEIAFNKLKTNLICQSLGISCPKILSEEEAAYFLKENVSAKVVVKPCVDIGGARGISIIETKEELQKSLEIAKIYAEPMIQEYIPGSSRNMRTVNLIFDNAGKLAAYFTTQKIREWPNSGGNSVLSISTDDRQLVEWIQPFFEKYHWRGPVEIEIKMDDRDGQPKLIEINPRFCGYIGFAIECGVNLPKIACELALEKELPVKREYPKYTAGIKYIHTSSYFRAAMQELLASANKVQTLNKLHEEWRGKKVGNNIKMRDWRVILIKAMFEIFNKGDSPDVWD